MRRLGLFLAAAPLGLVTGLAAWLLAGGMSVKANALDDAHARLLRLKAPSASVAGGGEASAATLLGSPLFALTTGPGAVRDPAIRLDGVSVSRRRLAALIAIDARPAEWWTLGETRDGVTLQAVSASGISVETALGPKTLNLGEQSAASSPAPGGGALAAATPAAEDRMPLGYRGPPEPASAPAVAR